VPRLCELYHDICLTTEEEARKNRSQNRIKEDTIICSVLLIGHSITKVYWTNTTQKIHILHANWQYR